MPVPLNIRMILYGLFGVSDTALAVAHWFVLQGSESKREVARQFGVPFETLRRSIQTAKRRITQAAQAEGLSFEEMLGITGTVPRRT